MTVCRKRISGHTEMAYENGSQFKFSPTQAHTILITPLHLPQSTSRHSDDKVALPESNWKLQSGTIIKIILKADPDVLLLH